MMIPVMRPSLLHASQQLPQQARAYPTPPPSRWLQTRTQMTNGVGAHAQQHAQQQHPPHYSPFFNHNAPAASSSHDVAGGGGAVQPIPPIAESDTESAAVPNLTPLEQDLLEYQALAEANADVDLLTSDIGVIDPTITGGARYSLLQSFGSLRLILCASAEELEARCLITPAQAHGLFLSGRRAGSKAPPGEKAGSITRKAEETQQREREKQQHEQTEREREGHASQQQQTHSAAHLTPAAAASASRAPAHMDEKDQKAPSEYKDMGQSAAAMVWQHDGGQHAHLSGAMTRMRF